MGIDNNEMKEHLGNLTPPTNNTVTHRRYVGEFGQPDGFSGMLRIRVNEAGRCELRVWMRDLFNNNKVVSAWIALDNEQRLDLAKHLGRHKPVRKENIIEDGKSPDASRIVE